MSSHAVLPLRRMPLLAALVATVLVTPSLVFSAPAFAAPLQTITVASTSDSDASGACANPAVTTLSSPVTLRNALCVANNLGGTVDVIVPDGSYQLLSAQGGALRIGTQPGAVISVAAADGAAPVIRGDGTHQVMILDELLLGDVDVSLTGLTITGGVDTVYGGGAIIGGSGKPDVLGDTLTITDSTISDSTASASNSPGGGIQFIGGALSIVDSTVSGNSSGGSAGGGVAYRAIGVAGESLTISGSTFNGNSTTGSPDGANGGGAIVIDDLTDAAALSITDSTFTGNSATGTADQAAVGGALWLRGGHLDLDASTFTGNSLVGEVPAAGAALHTDGGVLSAHYNRIVDNLGGAGSYAAAGATVTADNNWWGCNAGPGTAGCDAVAGAGASVATPYLTLSARATPATIMAPEATTAALTADLLTNSAGTAVAASSLGAFAALPIAWSAVLPSGAGVADAGTTLADGATANTYNTNGTRGAGSATATLDHADAIAELDIVELPTVTSGPEADFSIGVAGSFTITTTGFPRPTITLAPATLPTGLSFVDNLDGTATISGTPGAGSGGDYPATITATASPGGTPATDTQSFVLHVTQAPNVTSANATTFAAGAAGSFTVTTTGSPVPAPITIAGTLPAWLSFVDAGDGTATLAGTPPVGSGRQYPFTITAANGFTPNATQSFTLTVTEPPRVTSAAAVTVATGTPASFAVTTAPGYPAAAVLTVAGTLPAGMTFVDNGNGSATLSGTPATTAGGSYPLVVTAANGSTPNAQQTLTVTVTDAAAVTLNPVSQSVTDGTAVTFAAAATGFPAPTVAWWVSTDAGVSYNKIPGAVGATLSLTAALAQSGNLYRATFTNGAVATTTAATLTVGTVPVIESGAAATFTVSGVAQSFPVTASGTPAAALTLSGTVPAWLGLADAGDGTATVSGIAPAGSGGTYSFTVTAANGFGAGDTQVFTLTVTESAAFTSAADAAFQTGVAGSFTVTSSAGFPAARALAVSGTLPAGVSFVDNGDGTGTLAGTPAAGTGGTHPLTFTASTAGAADAVQTFTLTVNEAVGITSGSTATFSVGAAGSFAVTTEAGFPAAAVITVTGTLPAGLTFTDNGDGTATLAGTPAAGSGRDYALTVTASNGIDPDAVAPLTLTVSESPVITLNPVSQSAIAGEAWSMTAGAAPSFPAATVAWWVSTNSGLTYDRIPGAVGATLSLTAALPQSGNRYRAVFSNGTDATTSAATLTVGTVPVIESGAAATFTVSGVAQSFPVTASGTPAAALTLSGTVPAWLGLADAGDGTATVSGIAPAGSGGTYSFTVTAANGFGAGDTQVFTLTVTESAAFTSAADAAFQTGVAGSFTVTSSAGFPAVTALAVSGTLPAGVSFVDNGDGTGTLAGTPAAGTGGTHPLTFTASTAGAADAVQTFTLTVNEAVGITSPGAATFVHGVAGSFTVTTSPAFPAAVTLTVSGTVPAGLTFTDNGDGTGTLSGTTSSAPGAFPVTLTAANGVGAGASASVEITVVAAASVPLPPTVPTGDGSLGGVPGTAGPGQVLTLTGTGFAPGAPVTVGLYPSGTVLGTGVADADGRVSVTVTLPVDLSGAYSLVLTGLTESGDVRYLRSDLTVAAPVVPGSAGSVAGSGAGASQSAISGSMAETGVAYSVAAVGILGALALLLGLGLVLRRRRRSQG